MFLLTFLAIFDRVILAGLPSQHLLTLWTLHLEILAFLLQVKIKFLLSVKGLILAAKRTLEKPRQIRANLPMLLLALVLEAPRTEGALQLRLVQRVLDEAMDLFLEGERLLAAGAGLLALHAGLAKQLLAALGFLGIYDNMETDWTLQHIVEWRDYFAVLQLQLFVGSNSALLKVFNNFLRVEDVSLELVVVVELFEVRYGDGLFAFCFLCLDFSPDYICH